VELIRQKLGDWNHGGTFSHHPVACAAALATLHILQKEKLVENAANLGPKLGQMLQEALGDHPHVGEIRGRGLFWGIELVQDRESKVPFPASRHVAWDVAQRAFEKGLLVYYSQGCADGQNGDVIMLGPPLIVTEAQLVEMVGILAEAVQEVLPG
jgi:adenosylmethionine-8-amino-7-oxononanoate aminotransferase